MKKLIIGLTGQSGAGKTLVSSIFKQQGFEIINADEISREVVKSKTVLTILSDTFGDEVVEGENLNRKKLGNIVFSDKEKLLLLNNIMFPLVRQKIDEEINQSSNRFILLDAPQLFEAEANKMCDYIVSVIASEEKLIERIIHRDKISKTEANGRLCSQYSQAFFKENSDFIINNNCTIQYMCAETDKIIESIKRKDRT